MIETLTDGWWLRGFLGDDWRLHRAHSRDGGPGWVPARVPGTVLADLLAAGEVPDPYVGRQSLLSEWVPQRTWVYRRRLSVPGHGRAFLEFDGIDHSATVFLDGEPVAAHEGMFVPLVVELSEPGDRLLAVVIDPAPPGEPQVGRTSRVRTHRSRMGYGWDFCPRLVQQGLWAPVRLRTTGPLRLSGLWARPHVSGRIAVTLEVDGDTDGATVECALDGRTVSAAAAPVTEIALEVGSPRRWRPGEPHLYTLTVVLRDRAGRISDERDVRIGFADIGFRRERDGALPYRMTVDGRPVHVNGWNWVPADALYGSVDAARLRHLLTLARDAGVTMLRVWGGGLIESEAFYDLCDELGILVWQEFAQSSSGIASLPSDDPAFVELMAAEARRIVPARRNHPSLAIWCGGNELQRADGVPLTEDESPVLAALRDEVTRLDPDKLWLPTSPSGPAFGHDPGREQHDVHGPWEHQGLDEQYRLYDGCRALLLSEFGAEGMSNLRAIESVVPEPSLPTTGDPTWDHLGRWWNNEPLVREAFGGGIEDIATLSRASQFLQADALRYAVEASRRRPESCGVLPWQFNESFPNGWCTCAVDYFGEPKAAYHYVRRSYRPLHACARLPAPRVTGEELTATVWAWAPHDAPGSVAARAVLLDGRQVAQARWDVRVGTPRAVGEIRCPLNGRPFLLEVTASAGGRSSANRYLLTAAAGFGELLRLPPARVSTKLSASGEEWTLRLRHEAGPVAPFLRLLDARPAGHSGWMRWDDNAIDLLPGEERVLRCRWDGVAPEDRRVRLDGWNVRGEVRQWT